MPQAGAPKSEAPSCGGGAECEARLCEACHIAVVCPSAKPVTLPEGRLRVRSMRVPSTRAGELVRSSVSMPTWLGRARVATLPRWESSYLPRCEDDADWITEPLPDGIGSEPRFGAEPEELSMAPRASAVAVLPPVHSWLIGALPGWAFSRRTS